MKNLKATLALITAGIALSLSARAQEANSVSSSFGFLGENGFIKYGGGMEVKSDETTGELLEVILKGGVHVEGDLNLDCDELVVDNAKQILKASGKIIRFSNADIKGTCGRLTMHLDTKRTILEINPEVEQRAADGSKTIMKADKIIMTTVGEATNVTTEGAGEIRLNSANASSAKKDGKKTAKPAQKIDTRNPQSLGKISSPRRAPSTVR